MAAALHPPAAAGSGRPRRWDAVRAEVLRRVEPVPQAAPVVERVMDDLCGRGDLAVAFRGSIAAGTVDEHSDIDMLVVPTADEPVSRVHGVVRAAAERAGDVVTWFPATHLGMDDLLIFFFERDGRIVKIDANLVALHDLVIGPSTLIACDPDGRLAAALSAPPVDDEPPQADELRRRFAGWAWYTYTKTARGELLEADDSLGLMRSAALLPLLRRVERITPYGYRFIERQLTPGILERLRRTYPAAPDRHQLLRCLDEMTALFQELDRHDDRGDDPVARVARAIRAAERAGARRS